MGSREERENDESGGGGERWRTHVAGEDWLKEESFSLSPKSLSWQQHTKTHVRVLGVVLIRNLIHISLFMK